MVIDEKSDENILVRGTYYNIAIGVLSRCYAFQVFKIVPILHYIIYILYMYIIILYTVHCRIERNIFFTVE